MMQSLLLNNMCSIYWIMRGCAFSTDIIEIQCRSCFSLKLLTSWGSMISFMTQDCPSCSLFTREQIEVAPLPSYLTNWYPGGVQSVWFILLLDWLQQRRRLFDKLLQQMEMYIRMVEFLKKASSYNQFEYNLPLKLKDVNYLSLLLGKAIELQKQPFSCYLQLLLQRGALLNYNCLEHKMTLFMLAGLKGNAQVVAHLLEVQTLETGKRDQEGKNVLHYAIHNKNQQDGRDIIDLIIEKSPHLIELGGYSKGNYLTICIEEQKVYLFRYFLSELRLDPNQKSPLGHPLQHEVIKRYKKHKDTRIVEVFLEILLGTDKILQFQTNNNGQDYIKFNSTSKTIKQQVFEELINRVHCSISCKKIATLSTLENEIVENPKEEEKNTTRKEIQIQIQQEHQQSDSESYEDESIEERHVQLSQQIMQTSQQYLQIYGQTYSLIEPILISLSEIAEDYDASIQIIGTFAMGLWMPFSDVDILISWKDQSSHSMVLEEQIIESIYRKVQRMGVHSRIISIRKYKLPLFKMTLKPEFKSLELEIFICSKSALASKYVMYTCNILSYYPQIQAIYFTMRKILQACELHEHRKGGLKAYAIFLLIYNMRKSYQYDYLSQFIEHFAYYYGFLHQYEIDFNEEQDEYQMRINIVDPLNEGNNMGGKKTRVSEFQNACKKIYYGINIASEGSKLEYLLGIVGNL